MKLNQQRIILLGVVAIFCSCDFLIIKAYAVNEHNLAEYYLMNDTTANSAATNWCSSTKSHSCDGYSINTGTASTGKTGPVGSLGGKACEFPDSGKYSSVTGYPENLGGEQDASFVFWINGSNWNTSHNNWI